MVRPLTPPVLTAGPRTARRFSQLARTARCACMICQLRRPSSLTPERTTAQRAWPLPHPAPSPSRTRSTPRCGIPPRHASLPRRSALLRACVTRQCALSTRRTGGYARHTPSWITGNALSPHTPSPSTLLLTSRPSLSIQLTAGSTAGSRTRSKCSTSPPRAMTWGIVSSSASHAKRRAGSGVSVTHLLRADRRHHLCAGV